MFTLHMVHCIPIKEKLHLYVYGEQECYTSWQYGILFALLPIVIMFPLTFGMSLNLLKDELISTNSFLLAAVVPYYAFYLYLKKILVGLQHHRGSTEDQRCAEEILEMEEMLFKADDQGIRWPVVQLYRNLLVVVLNTVILNRLYLTISYNIVFVCFLLHDRHRMPYKHSYLNHLQALSSAALFIVNACNMPASISSNINIWAIPYMEIVAALLGYVELFVLACIPLSLIAWKAKEKFNSSR